ARGRVHGGEAVGEGPVAVEGGGTGRHRAPADLAARLVEVRVVHAHVGGVGRVLVDEGEAAVTEVRVRPLAVRAQHLRAVVLRAADHELAVHRGDGNALELGGAEAGVVEAGPGRAAVIRAPDAAVTALVHAGGIAGGEGHRVAVRVQAAGDGRG